MAKARRNGKGKRAYLKFSGTTNGVIHAPKQANKLMMMEYKSHVHGLPPWYDSLFRKKEHSEEEIKKLAQGDNAYPKARIALAMHEVGVHRNQWIREFHRVNLYECGQHKVVMLFSGNLFLFVMRDRKGDLYQSITYSCRERAMRAFEQNCIKWLEPNKPNPDIKQDIEL